MSLIYGGKAYGVDRQASMRNRLASGPVIHPGKKFWGGGEARRRRGPHCSKWGAPGEVQLLGATEQFVSAAARASA